MWKKLWKMCITIRSPNYTFQLCEIEGLSKQEKLYGFKGKKHGFWG